MSRRLALIVIALLTAALATSLWANVRGRAQLHEAERFMKSSLASWSAACLGIASLTYNGKADLEALHCVAASDRSFVVQDSGPSDDYLRWRQKHDEAVSSLIIHRALDNLLPKLLDDDEMEQVSFPAGYSR